MRAMNLKQQIIFASNASDSLIKCEFSPVPLMFLHVLETGFQDNAVRAKVFLLPENSSVTDEQLMEKINHIMSVENERQKTMASKEGVRVNTAGRASVSNDPT